MKSIRGRIKDAEYFFYKENLEQGGLYEWYYYAWFDANRSRLIEEIQVYPKVDILCNWLD